MTDPQTVGGEEGATLIDRREFVRGVAWLAVGVASTPLLAACDFLGTGPTATPVIAPSTPTVTPDATSTQFLPAPATVNVRPSATPTSAATATTPATATQKPQAPEATPSPSNSATPQAAALPTVGSAVPGPHGVALLASTDRATAVPAVLALLGFAPDWLRGKKVALKANFNSADPPPGSTHLETLRALLESLQDWGAAKITLLERSGMGNTGEVLGQRGVMDLAARLGVDVVVLDDLPARDWVEQEGAHWERGFLFPRVVQEADAVVQTCCLKTHRFGGHFTMSLKNSVGLVAKYDPTDGYNYMGELHGSANQRLMIAEINAAYKPALILLDGVLAFVSGGPDQGKTATAGVVLAGRDRVAIDAVGVAMLRSLGTTPEVSRGSIFDQPQIARAVALGLGALDPAAISLHPAADEASQALAGKLQQMLTA